VWHAALAQVLPRPQLIFLSKTWFLGIYLNFQQHKSLKNQYIPHFESKSYQINSIRSCSSRSFQEYQRHIPIIQYSRTFAPQVQMSWNQALLINSFPKTPRTRSNASLFSGSDNYKNNIVFVANIEWHFCGDDK
jgi:hypothetical protein